MSEQFSGTKEVSEKLAFNLEDLKIYLEKKDIKIGNILNYEQFKGGQSNPTYLLTSENNKYVLRRKPPVSYTHLRAHETGRNLVFRLLL